MQTQLIDDLSREVERLRAEARTPALPTTSPEALRLEELHDEMTALRAKNAQLLETNEELHANLLHARVERGLELTAEKNNLAAELEEMSQDEVNLFLLYHIYSISILHFKVCPPVYLSIHNIKFPFITIVLL